MQAAGAEMLDIARDIAWFTAYGWGTRFRSEFEGLSSTNLLDSIVRGRLKQIPNVEILQGCEVIGLVGELNDVEGVRLRVHGEKMDLSMRFSGQISLLRQPGDIRRQLGG